MESGRDAHRHFEQLAVAHVLGGLDDTDARVFRSHLLECGTCRARVGELRAIAHDLADVERDERRVRAAKAVETKKRVPDVERSLEAEEVTSSRTIRVAMTVGLVLIIAMTGWNFLLRQTLTAREGAMQQLELAATLLHRGQPAEITAAAEEVDAEVRYGADGVVVAVGGVVPQARYGVYLTDEAGNVLDRPRQVVAGSEHLVQLLPRVPGAATVTMTQPDAEGSLPDTPDQGRPILQAVLPSPQASAGPTATPGVDG